MIRKHHNCSSQKTKDEECNRRVGTVYNNISKVWVIRNRS